MKLISKNNLFLFFYLYNIIYIMIIYKRSFNKISINNFNEYIWFSLEPNYGIDSYGSFMSIFHLDNKTKLLNIGKCNNRKLLIKMFKRKYPDSNLDPDYILDPDEQYSGGKANEKAQKLIKSVIGDYFDGTIIQDINADVGLKGPTEIVLWNFNNLKKFNQN